MIIWARGYCSYGHRLLVNIEATNTVCWLTLQVYDRPFLAKFVAIIALCWSPLHL